MAGERVTIHLEKLFDPSALGALADPMRQAFVMRLMAMARAKWIRLAQAQLHTSRRSYIAGISAIQEQPGVASITLMGQLPNMVESGSPARDLHQSLLGADVPVVPARSGQKGKHTKKGGGYWRVVPFRSATPGTDGAVGPAMGSAYVGMLGEARAKALGDHIYKMAKQLAPSRVTPAVSDSQGRPKTAWGGRIARKDAGPLLRPHHHSPIYSGLVREQKTYEKATQNKFVSFRMISTGSPGWRVAAKEGKHLLRQVKSFADGQAPATFDFVLGRANLLRGLGQE